MDLTRSPYDATLYANIIIVLVQTELTSSIPYYES